MVFIDHTLFEKGHDRQTASEDECSGLEKEEEDGQQPARGGSRRERDAGEDEKRSARVAPKPGRRSIPDQDDDPGQHEQDGHLALRDRGQQAPLPVVLDLKSRLAGDVVEVRDLTEYEVAL